MATQFVVVLVYFIEVQHNNVFWFPYSFPKSQKLGIVDPIFFPFLRLSRFANDQVDYIMISI